MATILTTDILNTVGPGIYMANSISDLQQALTDIRVFTQSITTTDVTVMSITPIVGSYSGSLNLNINNTGTDTQLSNIDTVNQVLSGNNTISLTASIQYLLQYSVDPKS